VLGRNPILQIDVEYSSGGEEVVVWSRRFALRACLRRAPLRKLFRRLCGVGDLLWAKASHVREPRRSVGTRVVSGRRSRTSCSMDTHAGLGTAAAIVPNALSDGAAKSSSNRRGESTRSSSRMDCDAAVRRPLPERYTY
jgi:hypothetical protein